MMDDHVVCINTGQNINVSSLHTYMFPVSTRDRLDLPFRFLQRLS